jgi:hypothetical protein
MDSTLISALIGIAGIFIGIFLAEFFRRRSKIEKFTEVLFNKRLNIYEELFEKYLDLTNVFYALNESNSEAHEKLDVWQQNVFDFLRWMDKKFMFIGDELSVHLSLTLLSAGDFIDGDRTKSLNEVLSEFGEAKLLIRKSLGLDSIENDFIRTSKSSLSSNYIEYYQNLKKKKRSLQ